MSAEFRQQAKQCLFLALHHTGEAAGHPLESLPDDINDFSRLHKILEYYGFVVQEKVVSWNTIFHEDFPLVLQYGTEPPRFVKSVQGNTLVFEDKGAEVRFIPDDWSDNPTVRVLHFNKMANEQSVITVFSLKWYQQLFKENWFITGQMVMASLMVQLFAIGMPVLYMVIFDRVFGRQNLDTLNVLALGMAIVLGTDFLVKQLRAFVLANQMEMVDKLTLQAFLKQLALLPLSGFTGKAARGYTDKFSEMPRVNEAVTSMMLVSSLDVVFSVLIVILLMLLHFQLAAIALAAIIPIAVLSFWVAPRVKERALSSQKSQRVYRLKLSELIENAETLKAANADTQLRNKIASLIDQSHQEGFRSRYDQTNSGNMQGFIAQLGSLVTLYFGAKFVLSGEISFGVYIAINMLSKHVMGVVQKLFVNLSKFQESLGTLREMQTLFQEGQSNVTHQEALQETTDEGIRPEKLNGSIAFHGVKFKYEESQDWILNNINLSIADGEKVIITGQSGAGKTTLIRLIQKLFSPNQGYITLDKYNLKDFDGGFLRSHIGVAVQKPALFAGTLADNIALSSPYAKKQQLLDAASFVGLDHYLAHSQMGLETPVNPMGSNLSGGQAASVALSRVLLQQPHILILDEALAQIDPSSKAIIYSRLFEKYKHKTLIMVTDFLPVHQRADRILVLDKGQIVEEGNFKTLTQQQGYYALYHQPAMIQRGNS